MQGKPKSCSAVTGTPCAPLLTVLRRLECDKLVWVDCLPRMPSSNSFRTGRTQRPLCGRESSPVWRSTHQYVLTLHLTLLRLKCRLQYLGLHPHVFKHQVTKAAEVVQTTKTFVSDLMKLANQNNQPTAAATTKKPVAALPPPETATEVGGFWQRWGTTALAVGGAVIAAGAAAGAAYHNKEEVGIGYAWAMDHMKYVASLCEEKELNKRLDTVVSYDRKMGILFRT